MQQTTLFKMVCLIQVAVLLVGCAGLPSEPTLTPVSIEPTATPTPIPAEPTATPLPIIKTTLADIEVAEVQLSDRFPPDCENPPSPGCDQPKNGFQILVIWLDRADGGAASGIRGTEFLDQDIYVLSGNGTRSDIALAGFAQSRLFVAFTPTVSAKQFTLYWPSNSPIELGQ